MASGWRTGSPCRPGRRWPEGRWPEGRWPGARKGDQARPGRDRAGRDVTRRIALALVLLTAAVLIAAVVPLALGAIDHERDAFVSDTARTANSIASLARDTLEGRDTDDGPALRSALHGAERIDDEVLVQNQHGETVPLLS